MRATPGPGRVLTRGLLWGPVLGGTVGAGVWIAICLVTLALPAVVLTPLAFGVGAAVGVVPGLAGATAVAALARTRPVTPGVGGAIAATVGAGLAFDLTPVLVWSDLGPGAVIATFAVATVLLGGTGAVGGQLVARPGPARHQAATGAPALDATDVTTPPGLRGRDHLLDGVGGPRRH